MEGSTPALEYFAKEMVKLGGQLSGIVGDSAHTYGYHRGANYIPSGDYSKTGVDDRTGGDREGASAVDWSLPDSLMKKYTSLLDKATKTGNPDVKYLREFYGTKNGSTVHGRNHDTFDLWWEDASSDDSHLWHIHFSFFRRFNNSMDAMNAVLRVLDPENKRNGGSGGSDELIFAPFNL